MVQAAAGDVMNIQGSTEQPDNPLEEWQLDFSKHFNDVFKRVGRIRNYKYKLSSSRHLCQCNRKADGFRSRSRMMLFKKIEKLLSQRHLGKLDECSGKHFTSPIVFTVKKDGSIKLALESRELNKQVHKNKYQMPNNEEIMDTDGQTISENRARSILRPWI